jgi:TRAP-type mannitol/chloroaromatic compound transport system permease small subunit
VGANNDDDPPGRSPHRDDHEAAIQRADALQRELDAERAKGTKNNQRLAQLEADIKKLREEMAAEATASGKPSASVAAAAATEPPVRSSHLSMDDLKPSFPDDSAASALVRKIDDGVGMIEQGLLFGLLAAVVLTAATAAIYDKVLHEHLGRWWFTVVRGGTFTVAMLAAAFATHQQRHLAMDLVSRRISPRARLVLGMILKLFTIVIAVLLFRSGMHQRDHVGGTVEEFVSDKSIVTMLPIGASLIILHSLLHIVIDIDYLVRGKLLPERARSGH